MQIDLSKNNSMFLIG